MRGDIRAYPLAARELSKSPANLLRKRAYTYGITVEYLQAMLERGVCDACGTTEPGE